jgi:hypothetical protein
VLIALDATMLDAAVDEETDAFVVADAPEPPSPTELVLAAFEEAAAVEAEDVASLLDGASITVLPQALPARTTKAMLTGMVKAPRARDERLSIIPRPIEAFTKEATSRPS